jgi:integrase
VSMPDALERKYPLARLVLVLVFPASTTSIDPRTGVIRRHHLFEHRLQRALKQAIREARIVKPITVHTLRHSLAIICSNRAPIFGPCRSC